MFMSIEYWVLSIEYKFIWVTSVPRKKIILLSILKNVNNIELHQLPTWAFCLKSVISLIFIKKRSSMFSGEYIFSQVMDHLPMHNFRKCVKRYSGNRYVMSFNCFDRFLCMALGQLTHKESLRDIEICLWANNPKLCHIGI